MLAVGVDHVGDLPVPGRELDGIHQAMEYLPQSNRASLGEPVEGQVRADGKHVVIIGGGDTGADCLGTAIRQHAKSITQLEIMPRPGEDRPAHQPWPTYPMTVRVSSAHEEAGERVYSVSTQEFLGDDQGNVRALRLVEGSRREVRADRGHRPRDPGRARAARDGLRRPGEAGLVEQLGVELDERGNIVRDATYATTVEGVFVAGDAGRGQSLIVGRSRRAGLPPLRSTPSSPGRPRCPPDPADRAPGHCLSRGVLRRDQTSVRGPWVRWIVQGGAR